MQVLNLNNPGFPEARLRSGIFSRSLEVAPCSAPMETRPAVPLAGLRSRRIGRESFGRPAMIFC